MSLNKALQTMLRRYGRPVRYKEDNRMAVTTALITPCTGSPAGLRADVTGFSEENRFVYISVSQNRPPAMGSIVYSGGNEYRVEQSGTVKAGGAIDYVWALLMLHREAEAWKS